MSNVRTRSYKQTGMHTMHLASYKCMYRVTSTGGDVMHGQWENKVLQANRHVLQFSYQCMYSVTSTVV